MSNSLQSHGLQHARVPSPPLSPRVCSDSCPLNQWCCLTILSSAALFSFCLQSFPASESFPMNWLFASDGQSTGASTLASVLPVNFKSCSFHYYLLINEKLKHHMPGDVLAPVKVLETSTSECSDLCHQAAKTLGLPLPFNSYKAVIQMQTLKTPLLVINRWTDHCKTWMTFRKLKACFWKCMCRQTTPEKAKNPPEAIQITGIFSAKVFTHHLNQRFHIF